MDGRRGLRYGRRFSRYHRSGASWISLQPPCSPPGTKGVTDVSKPTFAASHKATLDALLLTMPGVAEGKMFGYPAYYVNGRLFACIYGEGVGVKVPEPVARQLVAKRHVVPFRPFGKPPMREWIQLNRDRSADYHKDLGILRASVEFVSRLPKESK